MSNHFDDEVKRLEEELRLVKQAKEKNDRDEIIIDQIYETIKDGGYEVYFKDELNDGWFPVVKTGVAPDGASNYGDSLYGHYSMEKLPIVLKLFKLGNKNRALCYKRRYRARVYRAQLYYAWNNRISR